MSNLPTPGAASPQGVRPPPDIPDLFGRADKNVPVKEGESRKTWVLAGAVATAGLVLFMLVIMVGVLLDRDGSGGGGGNRVAATSSTATATLPSAAATQPSGAQRAIGADGEPEPAFVAASDLAVLTSVAVYKELDPGTAGQAEIAQFKQDFITDAAAKLGVDASLIVVDGLKAAAPRSRRRAAAAVVVHFTVLPPRLGGGLSASGTAVTAVAMATALPAGTMLPTLAATTVGALAAPKELEVGGLLIRLQAEAEAAEAAKAELAACASAGTGPVTATVTVQTRPDGTLRHRLVCTTTSTSTEPTTTTTTATTATSTTSTTTYPLGDCHGVMEGDLCGNVFKVAQCRSTRAAEAALVRAQCPVLCGVCTSSTTATSTTTTTTTTATATFATNTTTTTTTTTTPPTPPTCGADFDCSQEVIDWQYSAQPLSLPVQDAEMLDMMLRGQIQSMIRRRDWQEIHNQSKAAATVGSTPEACCEAPT